MGFTTAEVAHATVVSSTPSTPAPADTISYTVSVNTDNGSATYSGVKPVQRQWPTAMVDTVPAPPGTPCYIMRAGGLLFLFLTESPDIGDCP
jgi:hypothetical protein